MKKQKINQLTSLVLVFGIFLMMLSGCTYAAQGIKGDGNVIKQERSVSPFSGIEVGGAFKVFLTQGDKESLVVEADENLLEIIETEVHGNTLKISTNKDIRGSEAMNVYITFKSLKEIDVSGACNLTGENTFKLEDLDLDCSGASDAMIKLSAASLSLDCSGASRMELYGTAESIDMDVSGASDLDALEFEVKVCNAEISGASHAKIFVTGELSAEVSGAGSLKYKGDAVIKNHDVSGAGSLKKY
jgi:hypothetical protein